MRRDVFDLLCLGAVEINVGVRRRVPALVKCDEAPVIRDRAEIETGLVLVKQRRFQVCDRHDEDVEELRITRVGRKKEGLPIETPAEKIRFRFFARCQIVLGAIELAQIKMLVLIPTPVVPIQKSRIVRKRCDNVSAFFRRIG